MARKIKKKLTRKELLKETDEFISFSEKATEWGRENWPLLLIAVGVAAVVVVVIILVRSSIADSKARFHEQVEEAVMAYSTAGQSELFLPPPEDGSEFDPAQHYEDVVYKFEKLLRDHPETQQDPTIMLYLANSFQKMKKYDKARENYKKVIALENAGSLAEMARHGIAMSFFLEDKYKEALTIFQKMYKDKTPTGRASTLVYGGVCFERLGKFDEAIE